MLILCYENRKIRVYIYKKHKYLMYSSVCRIKAVIESGETEQQKGVQEKSVRRF